MAITPLSRSLFSGLYPERIAPRLSMTGEWLQWLERQFSGRFRLPRQYNKQISKIRHHIVAFDKQSSARLHQEARTLRQQINASGLTPALQARALALVSEAIFRKTGMRAYDNQFLAALIMLDGRLAEMATGEGKTLSTILAAGTSALVGIPIHVLTANDYLVSRDGQYAADILGILGISVGWVIADQEPESRSEQYRCDVTYVTARELVFDYLKDLRIRQQRRGQLSSRLHKLRARGENQQSPLLRGLCFALVDEADSIFLDEATTPLILSRPGKSPVSTADYKLALRIANTLDESLHFDPAETGHGFELTVAGESHVKQMTLKTGGLWNVSRFRHFLVGQALTALYQFNRGREYVVQDGKVEIVDLTTGRIASGRQWSNGLHQLVELKEGCEVSPQNETIAQITYQLFFPRYLKLGGTSATLTEASSELRSIYGLSAWEVPRHQASRFSFFGEHLFTSQEKRWNAVTQRVEQMLRQGRPVLIGTDSVVTSEALSKVLSNANIKHAVLSAAQDREEAAVVASAGKPGSVTVTTNMAGRGTDIKITEAVRSKGGLHVINCQFNGSRRIDRQLLGRSARQGDPGSGESMLALDDLMFQRFLPIKMLRYIERVFGTRRTLPRWLAKPMIANVRRASERAQRETRKQLRQMDKQMRDWLAISGAGE